MFCVYVLNKSSLVNIKTQNLFCCTLNLFPVRIRNKTPSSTTRAHSNGNPTTARILPTAGHRPIPSDKPTILPAGKALSMAAPIPVPRRFACWLRTTHRVFPRKLLRWLNASHSDIPSSLGGSHLHRHSRLRHLRGRIRHLPVLQTKMVVHRRRLNRSNSRRSHIHPL